MGKFTPDKIDPFLCTHINFAFSFVKDDGTGLRTFEHNDVTNWGTGGMYSEVLEMKQLNNKLKVLLSVGGWTHGTGGFAKAAQSDTTRQNFATNALSFIQQNGFDGIDVDWEYPGFQDGPKPGHPDDVENHVLLLEELKRVFKPEGLMVTAAFGAPPSRVDESYPETERICNSLDMVNLMTYDFHGGWENVIGHHSPFTSDGNHPNDPTNTWNVKTSVDYWIEKGCPANKLTLGLGAYGRVFKATTSEVDRLQPGTTSGVRGTYTREDGYMAFHEICNWDSHIDSATQSAVAINGDLWAGFETVQSANVKLDYLLEKGMKGIMWWSLDLDDFDGQFCGQGKYPLISGVWENLKLKLNGHHPTTTLSKTSTTTTTTISSTTNSVTSTQSTTESVSDTSTTSTHTTKTTNGPSTTVGETKTTGPVLEDLNDYCKRLGDGLWAHPSSCSKYVVCLNGGAIAADCAPGLFWNSQYNYCDWEYNVDCTAGAPTTETPATTKTTERTTTEEADTTQSTSTTSTTTSTTTESDSTTSEDRNTICANNGNGFYKYPGNCEKFIQCHHGRTYPKTCAPGTVFNSNTNQCDWPTNVPEC